MYRYVREIVIRIRESDGVRTLDRTGKIKFLFWSCTSTKAYLPDRAFFGFHFFFFFMTKYVVDGKRILYKIHKTRSYLPNFPPHYGITGCLSKWNSENIWLFHSCIKYNKARVHIQGGSGNARLLNGPNLSTTDHYPRTY